MMLVASADASALNAGHYYSWQWGGFSRSNWTTSTSSSSASSLLLSSSYSAVSSLVNASSNSSAVSAADAVMLAGVVYYDENGDGIRDSSDWGIRDATLVAVGDSTGTKMYATTGKDGSYVFSGLDPDTYTVTLATPSNQPESPSIGTIVNAIGVRSAGLGQLDGDYSISVIKLEAGETALDYDFPQLEYPTSLFSKRLLLDDSPGLYHTTPVDPIPEPGSMVLLSIAGLLLGQVLWISRRNGPCRRG